MMGGVIPDIDVEDSDMVKDGTRSRIAALGTTDAGLRWNWYRVIHVAVALNPRERFADPPFREPSRQATR